MAERRWPKVLDASVRERDEPPLDDDALLVRGGQFRVGHVLARLYLAREAMGRLGLEVSMMTPDIWADFNQVDDDGHVVAYLEDIVHAERVVLGGVVVVADPEAKAHTAVVVGISPAGVVALDVDWATQPTGSPAGSTTPV